MQSKGKKRKANNKKMNITKNWKYVIFPPKKSSCCFFPCFVIKFHYTSFLIVAIIFLFLKQKTMLS